MVNITREYYTRFIASFLCCISDTEGCQYPGIWWIFFKSVVLNSAATGFQAPFQGRPLLGLILTHLPSQTEAALPLSCPSKSLTWCPGQSVAYIPFMPQIQHPSSHEVVLDLVQPTLPFWSSSPVAPGTASLALPSTGLWSVPMLTINAGLTSPSGTPYPQQPSKELQPRDISLAA